MYHIYLIQQGQTTNETFKWAKLMKKHSEMVAAHALYLELKEPENILKVENMSNLSDCHYLNPRGEQYNTAGHLSTSDTAKLVKKSNFENPKLPGHVNFSAVNMVQQIELGNESDNTSGDSNGTRNVCGSECRWQRSDSTSDGADSADIEVQYSTEKRKVGSSSSGSTSSSHRDSCFDDSDDDFLLVNDSEDDNGYCKIKYLAEEMSEEENRNVAVIESLEVRTAEPIVAVSEICCAQESHSNHADFTPIAVGYDLSALDSCPKFLAKPPGCAPNNIYKKGFFIGMKNVWTPPSLAALIALEKKQESRVAANLEVESSGKRGPGLHASPTREEIEFSAIAGDIQNEKIESKTKSA